MVSFQTFTYVIGATVLLFIDSNLPFVTANAISENNRNELNPSNLRASMFSRSMAERKKLSVRDLIGSMFKTFFCEQEEQDKPPTPSPTPAVGFPSLSPEEIASNLAAYEKLKFPVAFRDFDRAILEGYQDCDVLLDDVEEALQHLVNSLVKYNINPGTGIGWIEPFLEVMIFTMAITENSPEILTSEGSTEDSFETNNQYEGVDEADIVKSDGTFVYAVYGSEIIVLDVNGNELFRLQVGTDKDDDFYYGIAVFKEDPKNGKKRNRKEKNAASDQKNRRTTNNYHRSTPIAGLLLDGDKLVAITTNYNRFFGSTSSETELVLMNINPTNGALNITERITFPGTYKTARMIDSNAHVVTSSYIEKWDFENKFSRYNEEYDGLNGTEYAEVAYEKAAREIPPFAARIVQDLVATEDDCGHIAKISSFQNGLELDEDINKRELLDSLVSVISFHIPSGINNTAIISASFTPNSNMDIYATTDKIFLGVRGWTSTTEHNSTTDVTYVTAFDLSGASAVPNATGIIPGYTLNQFSFDYYNDYLRVATSTSAVGNWNSSTFTFQIERNATNQITIAQIDDNEIKIVGQLEDLGETERIYAVRFLGDRAFMVTFRQIDPFYTIDLSIPQFPVMRGELKIPGFSNYLHPVEEDFILAIGQDANDNGELQGLQIAIFDVSDMSEPQQVAKHVIDGWSFSQSQHDHFAFRFLPETEKLILPVSNSTFDGFQVFDITTGTDASIDLHFVVSHFDRAVQGPMCFGDNYLKPRSLVFQGDVMTLKGHSILGHDLDTGTELYRLDLDEDDENEFICFDWFF